MVDACEAGTERRGRRRRIPSDPSSGSSKLSITDQNKRCTLQRISAASSSMVATQQHRFDNKHFIAMMANTESCFD
jgi:hypothetical protein